VNNPNAFDRIPLSEQSGQISKKQAPMTIINVGSAYLSIKILYMFMKLVNAHRLGGPSIPGQSFGKLTRPQTNRSTSPGAMGIGGPVLLDTIGGTRTKDMASPETIFATTIHTSHVPGPLGGRGISEAMSENQPRATNAARNGNSTILGQIRLVDRVAVFTPELA
jgi:hypothetical protein